MPRSSVSDTKWARFALLCALVGCNVPAQGNETTDPAGDSDASSWNPAQGGRLIGVKIYDEPSNYAHTFARWTELGVNTVFASETVASAEAYRALAARHEIATFVILPIFYEYGAATAGPDVCAVGNDGTCLEQEWVEFVSPTNDDHRRRRVEWVRRLMLDLQPEGISIDFIRFFGFWEKIYPDTDPATIPNSCYAPRSLAAFAEHAGITLPDLELPALAEWIATEQGVAFTAWKCHVITTMIGELASAARTVDPNVSVNVHLVPWRANDFDAGRKRIMGQDVAAIGEIVDFVSPMTYSFMVGRDADWVRAVMTDMAEHSRRPVVPSIQVSTTYRPETMTVEQFTADLRVALTEPTGGVIFYNWPKLADDTARFDAAARILGERSR